VVSAEVATPSGVRPLVLTVCHPVLFIGRRVFEGYACRTCGNPVSKSQQCRCGGHHKRDRCSFTWTVDSFLAAVACAARSAEVLVVDDDCKPYTGAQFLKVVEACAVVFHGNHSVTPVL
jgi:hypothetical protein